MGILLTNEEIQRAKDLGVKVGGKYTISRAIAKAQLKKVMKWLKGHTQPVHGGIDLTEEDWQALLEEVE